MIPKKHYLSVDLGGTSLRLALLNDEAEIQFLKSIDAREVQEPRDLMQTLVQEIQFILKQNSKIKIEGLALGIPGLVNAKEGIVHQSPHFPLWKNIPLLSELTPHLPFPILMENDANQAALGEAWRGSGQDWPSFIMLTLGTGIGGGIIVDGKIFHGPSGFAGEIGHMVIDRNGLAGALGSRGTLESFCSQSGLQLQIQNLQKENRELSKEILALNFTSIKLPEELEQLALQGNSTAQEIWKDFGRNLGCGLASLGHITGIFRFIIGGGLAGSWELFIEACRKETSNRLYTSTANHLEIVRAKLENQAGLIGGVRLIQG